MGMERYKGCLIDGSAIPTFTTEHDWCSQGTIFRASRRFDSIVEIKRIRGPVFNSREAAEEHGLKLGFFPGRVEIRIFRYPCLKNFFHNCLITNDLKATKGLLSPFKLPLAVKLASALASRRSCAYGSDR